MITLEDFKKIDMRVGTIIEASINKNTRIPAYKMKIDFGPLGIKNSSAQITDLYKLEDLINKQVVAVFNLPPLKVSEIKSEVLILGALEKNGVVLLDIDKKVTNGSKIS